MTKKTEPQLLNMLRMSTKHVNGVNDRDTAWLSYPPEGLLSIEYDEGWFVHVPPDLAKPEFADNCQRLLPKSIYDILVYAHTVNAHWINLDADGEIYDGLPTYDW
jgi:hypothetical protein